MRLSSIFLYVLLLILVAKTRSIGEDEEDEEIDVKRQSKWDEEALEANWTGSKWLYHKGDAWPIHDYDGDRKPPWLYQNYSKPRIVEFYAPWCPFCQAFRGHYIQFARVMTEMTKELHGQQIEFYAISCAANKPICQDFRVKGFPQIRLFKGGSQTVTAKIRYYALHPYEILESLNINIDMDLGKNKELIESLQVQHKEKGDISFPPRTKEEVFDDAYRSFDFMLRYSVFMEAGEVEQDRQEKLEMFLELLRGFLPPAWKLTRYIREILEHFDTVMRSEEALLKICDKYKPPPGTWSYACTKGVEGMGYSCGLWQLFHIFSIGMLEWNGLLDETQEEMVVTTTTCAFVLRDFIEGFLDCEVCRENFLKAYDTCALNRCERLNDNIEMEQLVQLPLWLWETHNAVNQRLLREHGQQHGWNVTVRDQRLRRWPATKDCPTCWNKDGTWDEETIYKFLRTEYWIEDAITEEYRKDLFDGVDLEKVLLEEEELLKSAEEGKEIPKTKQRSALTKKGPAKSPAQSPAKKSAEGHALTDVRADKVLDYNLEDTLEDNIAGGEFVDSLIKHAASAQLAKAGDEISININISIDPHSIFPILAVGGMVVASILTIVFCIKCDKDKKRHTD